MSNQLPVEYVIGGACRDEKGSFVRCALRPSDCDRDGSVFTAPFRLASTDPTVAAECKTQESVRSVNLGRCSDADKDWLCTSDATACSSDQTLFEPYDAECTVQNDRDDRNDLDGPIFGMCLHESNPGRDWCAWQKSECKSNGDDGSGGGYVFSKAQVELVHMHPTRCACKDVHVGACVSRNDENAYFCAVVAEVCAAETSGVYEYEPALNFQKRTGKSCRLCDATWSGTIPAPTPSPTDSPVERSSTSVAPTATKVVTTSAPSKTPPLLSESNGDVTKSGDSLSNGALYGIIVGTVAFVGAVVVLLSIVKRRRNHRGEQNTGVVAYDLT